MTQTEELLSGDAVWIYGSGTFALQVAAKATELGLEVLGFCDHINLGKVILGSFQEFTVTDYSLALQGLVKPTIVIGVCNLYGDLHKIEGFVLNASPEAVVISPVEFNNVLASHGIDSISNYWLASIPQDI